MTYQLSLVIIVIIIVILLVYIWICMKHIDNVMSGFWSASEDFCESAGIDLFWVYMNVKTSSAWILINSDNKAIYNDIVSFKRFIINPYNLLGPIKGIIKFDISLDNFPSSQKFTLYPGIPHLLFHDDSFVYADLYKNALLTDEANNSC